MHKPPPDGLKVLILNADYTPMNVVHWKKAMKRLFESPCERCKGRGWVFVQGQQKVCNHCQGKGLLPPAVPVEYFDAGYTVRDGRGNEHLVPAVLANAHYVQRKHRQVPYSKRNVLRRDGYRCQYCGKLFPPQDLTIDHVIPRDLWKRGGSTDTPTQWKNAVAACEPCNKKKANQTPEQAKMPLRKFVNGVWVEYKHPKVPSQQEIALGLTYRHTPEEWEQYVSPFRKSVPKS